jgi:hypothetical protein
LASGSETLAVLAIVGLPVITAAGYLRGEVAGWKIALAAGIAVAAAFAFFFWALSGYAA